MDPLTEKHEGAVTRLTLNRPDKANALSAPLVEALIDAIERAGKNGTRLLVVDGAGSHFCAGFDFTDYENASEGDLALRFIHIETLLQALYHAPFETLALAHGRVFGAGADIVANCSTRVATPDAAALRNATLSDTRAEDMAALALSVSAPGLKERIRAFRNPENRV